MVDNTNIDFNYSLEKIKESLSDKIYLQETILDSDKINTTFESIENNLNKLYENTRYLEDAIDYCEAFLNLKIEDFSSEIKNTLKAIEDIRDVNKNQAYIEYLVPLKDDLSIKKDRDNSLLSDVYNNGELMLGTKNEEYINWNIINKKSSNVPYSNNISDINSDFDTKYRTFYIEEDIAGKGISETITITLDTPTKINFINIDEVNCNISNLRLVYTNGVEDYIKYNSDFFDEAIVAQIKFDITNKKYTTSDYYIQQGKYTDDVWNKIKDFEYRYILDASTKMEMEEVIARIHKNEYQETTTNIYNNDINENNLVKKTMYSYIFGINSITIKYVEQETDSCFISESINIGTLRSSEYIQLVIDQYLNENTSVEYSILDGDIEIPMLPIGTTIIKNERLFPAINLRFTQSSGSELTIKKDGMLANISLDDAKNQVLSKFSADYFTSNNYNYTAINSNIRVKVIIRKYTKSIDNSYVKSIKIRKYGGNAL